jgi:DNA-binding NarL/FixJ family response regulator
VRVLIADDAVLLRQGLVHILTEDGHEVVDAVGSGPALVAAARAAGPDVVIADVRMPPDHTDDGIRAARQTSHVLFCQVPGWRWVQAVVSS